MRSFGFVFVIAGPSGSGKSSLCRRLEQDGYGKFSVSATTRARGLGEIDGKDYFYCSKDEFERMIREDELLEWAAVHGEMYGTPRGWITEQLHAGIDVLLEIDVAGSMQVRDKMAQVTTVFVLPPSAAELKKRLIARKRDTDAQISLRLRNACQEILQVRQFDYVLVNDDLDKVYGQLVKIIQAHRGGEQVASLRADAQLELADRWSELCRDGIK